MDKASLWDLLAESLVYWQTILLSFLQVLLYFASCVFGPNFLLLLHVKDIFNLNFFGVRKVYT